jgi:hypothetical protein
MRARVCTRTRWAKRRRAVAAALVACASRPPSPPPFLLQVEAFDLLVPGMGEIVGGSAREERLGPLLRSLYKSPGEIIDPNAASSQLQPGWEDAVNNSALKW